MLRHDLLINEIFDDFQPLVLTHQDLNPRNTVVGENGCVWIVDWVGSYLPWFKYVALKRQNEEEDISGTNDELWKASVPFICGPYFRQDG